MALVMPKDELKSQDKSISAMRVVPQQVQPLGSPVLVPKHLEGQPAPMPENLNPLFLEILQRAREIKELP